MPSVTQTVAVNGRQNTVANVLDVTVTFAPTAAGSLLVLAVQTDSDAGTIDPPSGWSAVDPTFHYAPANANTCRMLYLPNCAAGLTSATFVCNIGFNTTVGFDAVFYEIPGADPTAPLDQHTVGNSGGNVNSWSRSTGATTVADEIVIASMGTQDAFQLNGENITAGYTQTHDGPSGAHAPNCVTGYKIVSATGVQSATFQVDSNGTSTTFGVGMIATFKAAPGVPASPSIGLQTVTVSQPAVSASGGASVAIGQQLVQYSQPAVTVGSGSGITVHIGLQTILVRQYPVVVRALRLDLAEPFQGTISVVQRSGTPRAATRQTGHPGAEG